MSEHVDITDVLRPTEEGLMAAWTLPNEGPLSDEDRKRAMANFDGYCKRASVPLEQVARELGTPRRTTISELLQGVYRANADDHVRKLNLWVEQHARRQAAALGDGFVETRVAQAFLTVTRLVRENGTMGLVIGPTGIGKTRCAQAVAETFVGSVYLRIVNGVHHASGLIHALAVRLAVREMRVMARTEGWQTHLERVIAVLRDSGRLLLLDEAHKLNDRALELLRDIHDSTGVPIMLIGVKDLHDRLARNIDPDHGQMYSRFDIIHHLSQGKDQYSGGKPLFTVAEIRQLYQQPPIRLSPDAVDYLQGVANQLGYGSLRRCKTLLRNAVRRARKRQNLGEEDRVTVTADDLAWVESRLRQESAEQDAVSYRKQRAVAGKAT